MYSDYFRAVLTLAHHSPRVQVTTGPAASHLASQVGFYFTPTEGAWILAILVVLVFAGGVLGIRLFRSN